MVGWVWWCYVFLYFVCVGGLFWLYGVVGCGVEFFGCDEWVDGYFEFDWFVDFVGFDCV